jgi:flagellar basal body-associated protein FliL
MVYFDDEASNSLKTITIIIAAVTAIAFGGMYFVYSSSQPHPSESSAPAPALEQTNSPAVPQSASPTKPAPHSHV